MLIFISGGVRSGKSALGERLVSRYCGAGRKVYLATSEAYDDEMERRIRRHQDDRAGKGFVTMEKSRSIETTIPDLMKSDAVLLDCLGALASNEMFGAAYVKTAADAVDALADRIYTGIIQVHAGVSTLVVISNEVFSDGVDYYPMTLDYIRLLGILHRRLAAASDTAIECSSGLHTVHKGILNAEY